MKKKKETLIKVLKITKEKGIHQVEFNPTNEEIQKQVNGYYGCFRFGENTAVLFDEEARFKSEPYTASVAGFELMGPILIVGCKREGFTSLSKKDIPLIKSKVKLL